MYAVHAAGIWSSCTWLVTLASSQTLLGLLAEAGSLCRMAPEIMRSETYNEKADGTQLAALMQAFMSTLYVM